MTKLTILATVSIFTLWQIAPLYAMEEEQARSAMTLKDKKQLKDLAANEDADALYELGLRYKYGKRGVSVKNPKKSFNSFEKAADKGHAKALIFQARMLLDLDKEGLFTEEERKNNEPKCLSIIKKRIKTDDSKAQHFLGWMYIQGKGVPENLAEGLHWYRKAAESGYVQAQEDIGCILVKQPPFVNLAEGFYFLKRAADQGSVRAKLALGKALAVDFPELKRQEEGLKILEELDDSADAYFIRAQHAFKNPGFRIYGDWAAKPFLEKAKLRGHEQATKVLNYMFLIDGYLFENDTRYYQYGFSPSAIDLSEPEI